MSLNLTVGSRRYSSWSLRPYLALVHSGLPFETTVIHLDTPTSAEEIAAVSPTGRVPVLRDNMLVIWDSLAICEYVAELAPASHLWPAHREARARARSISAEMHSSFAALREHMPYKPLASHPGVGHTPEALADAARVQAIWRDELAASGGPFLFGAFSIADAMFAPMASRFRTYGVTLDEPCAAYAAAIYALPAMQAWLKDAEAEPVGRYG